MSVEIDRLKSNVSECQHQYRYIMILLLSIIFKEVRLTVDVLISNNCTYVPRRILQKRAQDFRPCLHERMSRNTTSQYLAYLD